MTNTPTPQALFDHLRYVDDVPSTPVLDYIKNLSIKEADQEYTLALAFLRSYTGSSDTYNAYRREVERLCHWSWLIEKSPLKSLTREDMQRYFAFACNPPQDWIGIKTAPRFKDSMGQRTPNPEWRPFTAHVSKAEYKLGHSPDKTQYQLTPQSQRALFAGLSTFFTFLQQENYTTQNPVQMIRQKSRYIRKEQQQRVTRKLSHTQWEYVLETTRLQTSYDKNFERHLFLLSSFYLLGLRISELSDTERRSPTMGDFSPDQDGRWWFCTVGKGNKYREIAVPDTMLDALKRFRTYLQLPALPQRGDTKPLLPKLKGRGGLGTRQVRNLIQQCFDNAIEKLKQDGLDDSAADLAAATVHWLRHTAISADVAHRPREHVRDDAGHENISITDRYIDIERAERHQSARDKRLDTHVNAQEEQHV